MSSLVKTSVKTVKRAASATMNHMLDQQEQHEYRWEELQSIEQRRRAILLRVEDSFWKTLLYWDGTVLRNIVRDSLFWLTVAIFVAVRVQARLELPDFVANLTTDNVTVVGGFLTFFLVFYVNQNHRRYFGLYSDSMACKGRIFDVATLAVVTLPMDRATRLVRYMNAAHAAGYVEFGLVNGYGARRMNEINLDHGGSCNRELIAWCLMEIQHARSEKLLDPELANTFRTQILQLRASIGQLYNAADLPIPFFYIHFITLLTALYLPLQAISAALNAGTGDETHWTADLIAGLIVVLQSVFVIGLRTLGQKMSDPYGDDLIDLSVIHYVTFTWTMSNRVLESQFPESINWSDEQELKWQSKPLGSAWEPPKEMRSRAEDPQRSQSEAMHTKLGAV